MALPDGAYEAKNTEPEILRRWLESNVYAVNASNSEKENWSLICPPPNAYARPHIGNISGYGFQDVMARYQRMNGKNVLVIPGKDHAGLEGEGVFVREVLEKQGRKKFDMSREDFYAEMMEYFHKNMDIARNDEKRIGLSADFDKDTFTLDPDVVDTVLDTFIEMYQQGMIYKGVRIVNWDPKARTAVADNQVVYEDAVTPFYYFKYKLVEVDETKRKIWRLNFYNDGIFAAIKNGSKNIETRALNPEEPDRYFGEIKPNDVIVCVNKNTSEELTMLVKETRIYSSATDFFQGEDFTKINSNGREYSNVDELIDAYNLLADGYGEKLKTNGVVAIELSEFLGDPDPEALELKSKFENKEIEWSFERNKTKDGKNDLPFSFGTLNVETQDITLLQTNNIEIIGIGYDQDINPGDKLTGKVVGILMRMNAPHRLVLLNSMIDYNAEKEHIFSLQNEIQRIFEFESKHYAGSHIILFDEYPEDKFYTNGFIIGTVRPETIFADTAIACNPSDERYSQFIGKKLEVEFLGKKKTLSFISDYTVDKEFGTGLLKITPAHSNEDWEIAQRNKEACLPPIQVVGYDLKLNSLAGEEYSGLSIKEARAKLTEDMKNNGNLVWLDEKYSNRIKIAERTKAPIEPLLSSQWYLSYDVPVEQGGKTLRQAAIDMVKSEEVKIHPDNMVPKFLHWMENLRDWAISRTLWWGYRLPVWYHGEVKEEIGADGQVRELIKLDKENANDPSTTPIILVDAVRTLISANENYDLASFGLNKELADYLAELDARIVVVTNATNDGNLEKVTELLNNYNFEIFTLHKNPLKTQSEYFEKLADTLNIDLTNAIYFDHDQDNLNSAHEAGIKKTMLYTQDNESIKKWLSEEISLLNYLNSDWVPLQYDNSDHIRVQKESPGEDWHQDESVLDTWFSSGQWVYATLGKYKLLNDFFPTDVLVSAHDILENWDSRMMMFTYFKHRQAPFKNLFLTGLVLGKDGQKMSKSKGNVLDIDKVIELYGTDAVRMSFFYQNSAGANYSITEDKLKNFKQFMNKIWNASKFVIGIMSETGVDGNPSDRAKLFIDKLADHSKLVKENVTKNIDSFEFGRATDTLYHEFWHTYCDMLIEESKEFCLPKINRETKEIEMDVNDIDKSFVSEAMMNVLTEYIKMLHPFIPFITQRIWDEIRSNEDAEFLMNKMW